MLDNLKIDSTGKATILGIYAFMDGGTVMLKLEAIDSNKIEIWFTQKVILKVTDHNVHPAALLLNENLVSVRSSLEKFILSTVKNAKFADTINKYDKKCLEESIDYIESEQYVTTSKALNRI